MFLEKYESNDNEYEIPDLVYLFLRRKAYETLMRMKVVGSRTKKDFNDIVDYVKNYLSKYFSIIIKLILVY